MNEFDRLCKEFETIDFTGYASYLAEKAAKILPALNAVTPDHCSGGTVLALFILGAVVADGKLSEEEYALLYPELKKFFGDNIDYEYCRKMFGRYKTEAKQLQETVKQMIEFMGHLSQELKDDIIIVCLMICAIDGKVSAKEKAWIRQLAK